MLPYRMFKNQIIITRKLRKKRVVILANYPALNISLRAAPFSKHLEKVREQPWDCVNNMCKSYDVYGLVGFPLSHKHMHV